MWHFQVVAEAGEGSGFVGRPRGLAIRRQSCLRLVRALAAETHENWRTEPRYLFGKVGVVPLAEEVSATGREAA